MTANLDRVLSKPATARRLYVYTTPAAVSHAWSGKRDGTGLIKVGDTTLPTVQERIWQQFKTASTTADPFSVLLDVPATTADGRGYRDYDVHKVMVQNGVHRHTVGGSEWFEATIGDVEAAILQIETGVTHSGKRTATFGLRPEQQDAVDETAAYFTANPKALSDSAPHFLWNAKMRFGKTFTAYKLAQTMGWTRLLVLTYKPAVKAAWREDLANHVDFDGWQFVDANTNWSTIDETRPIVWFASFQDMLGRKAGQVKAHNEEAHLIEWDTVILDEYHFGSWRDNAKDLYDPTDEEEQKQLNAGEEFTEDTFPLTVNHYLYLSGTPFRALSEGQFGEDQIFSWTYTDEQREKTNWAHPTTPNPYLALPALTMFTYSLSDVARNIAAGGEFNEFDLTQFFKAKKLSDGAYKFDDEQRVRDWVAFVCGRNTEQKVSDLTVGTSTPMPYRDPRFVEALRHTIWYLPDVAACHAMAEVIRTDSTLHVYAPLIIAGNEAGMGAKALEPVEKAIGKHPETTRTITLSCGKLLTGVTVAPWAGIFMLRSSSSPEAYFQAAFRVQSPWTRRSYDDPNAVEILKTNCYVFDFDPNRALTLVTDYNVKLSEGGQVDVVQAIGEFVKFLPIFCFEAGALTELDPSTILDIASAGVGSTMLAKRWQAVSLVNVDNSVLLKLNNDPELLASLEQIEAFRALSTQVKTRIASEKELAKAKKENGKLTPEEDVQKKENNKWRKELRNKLLKFAARIPVFMYLTDHREATLLEVITSLDTGLFEKATGLTLSDFNKLQGIGVFVPANMNPAIWHFRRFEADGMTYAGGKTAEDMIGGWDTVYEQDGSAATGLREVGDVA